MDDLGTDLCFNCRGKPLGRAEIELRVKWSRGPSWRVLARLSQAKSAAGIVQISSGLRKVVRQSVPPLPFCILNEPWGSSM